MERSDVPNPGNARRWEYRVSAGETMSALVQRIRGVPGEELFLDITDHERLRTDGALRRTLAAAAVEAGKRVTFSVLGSQVGGLKPRDGERSQQSPTEVPGLSTASRRSSPAATSSATTPKQSVRRGSVPVTVTKRARGDVGIPRHGPSEWVGIGLSFPRLSATGRRVALTFTFLAGLLATAAVIFLVPRAEVAITPSIEPINAELTVRASTKAPRADPTSGVLPVRVVSFEQTAEGAFPVEHRVEHGERARGTIELVNRTGSRQRILSGSRLEASNGLIVRTEASAVVPPRGTVAVAVSAQEGGTKGNLRDGTLTFVALPRDARAVLFGRVTQPLHGGTDRPVLTLAEEDIRRAAEKLAAASQDTARASLQRELPPGTLTNNELIRIHITDAVAREPLGSEVRELHLTGKLRGEVFAVSVSDLLNLLETMALSRTEGTKTLGKPLTEDAVRVADVRWEDGTADLAVRIENVAHEAFDFPRIRERLAGRTRDGAMEYLRALPGVRDARVTLSPFWIRRVPSIPRNVQIELVLP